MMNLKKIREAFAQVLLSFSEISTDKGILAWNSEEDLKEGDEVFVVKEDGSREKAEDGDYISEDNKTIVVVEGKVASIEDPEAEVAPEEKPVEEEMACGGKKQKMEEIPVEVPVEEPVAVVEEPDDEKIILSKLEELMKRLARLEERLAKLEEAPAAEPVKEEFQKAVSAEISGNSHNDFLMSLAASGRR